MAEKRRSGLLLANEIGTKTEELPPEIRNQFPKESEGLGAFVVHGGTVGETPGVNDESAKLVPDFKPTRYELVELAKHYFDLANSIELDWESLGQVGSWDMRMNPFAWRRLETIRRILGDEETDDVLREARAKWEKDFVELATLPRCPECGCKHEHNPAGCPLAACDSEETPERK